MLKMNKTIEIFVETNEVIEREETKEEKETRLEFIENAKLLEIEKQQLKNKKAALLEKLGISEDEAKLLLA